MDSAAAPEPRPRCDLCFRPTSMCLCARTRRVENRTQLLVVQHRRERFHAIGTARIVRQGLRGVEILETLAQLPRPALLPGAALLYPGPSSRELSTLPADERPRQLVVLDGTWHHARRLFLDNDWIRALPRVRLAPAAPSRYRIRRQPAPHCVSTLESIVAAMRILEPELEGLDGLLQVFDQMIEEQQAFMTSAERTPRHLRRAPRSSRAIPAILSEACERLVVVYGETTRASVEPEQEGASAGHAAATAAARAMAESGSSDEALAAQRVQPTGGSQREGARRQLVRWSALRPFDGAVFDRLVRPIGAAPEPAQLAHMGLDPEQVARASELREVGRDWRSFRREGDLLVAWHPALLRMLTWLDADPSQRLALRAVYSNLIHARPPALETLVRELGLELRVPAVPGRAGERLGQAIAILRRLQELAARVAAGSVPGRPRP